MLSHRFGADGAKLKPCRARSTTWSYLTIRINGFTAPSFLPFLTVFAFAMIVFLLFLESLVPPCAIAECNLEANTIKTGRQTLALSIYGG